MTCIHVLQLCEPVVHPVIGFNSLFTFTYLPFTFTIVQSYMLHSYMTCSYLLLLDM